ncbi:MAG: hypothetical protein ABI823_20615, partial [Bryobacteraceae bacterium]
MKSSTAAASQEDRPIIKVFLASGQEFERERKEFEALIKRIGNLPHIARRYQLAPVHWQQGGGDTAGQSVQARIEASIQFEDVPIFLVLIGTYVGPGTLEEYEGVVATRKARGGIWPALYVFFKTADDGSTLVGDSRVAEFRRRVIQDKVSVPGHFTELAMLEERLANQLTQLLVPLARSDPLKGEVLRERFFIAATLTLFGAVIAIYDSSTMAFPSNAVSTLRVLAILVAPPLLFLLGLVTVWMFHRIIGEFLFAWNSVSYSDDRLFAVFKNLIPTVFVPAHIRPRFPSSAIGNLLNGFLLLLVGIVPLAAEFDCIFNEMVQWHYVVAPDEIVPKPTESDCNCAGQTVSSRYVQQTLTFPYTLTGEVADKYVKSGGPIFVYAEGMLGDSGPRAPRESFRKNMGPQVFLPWQIWLYIGLLAAHAALNIH